MSDTPTPASGVPHDADPATPAAPAPARKRRSTVRSAVIWGVIVLVAGASGYGIATLWSRAFPSAPRATAGAAKAAVADTRRIHALLFYVSDDGGELISVTREVPFGATPVEQARRILEAQVDTAPPGITSAVPAGTKVRSIFLSPRGDAYVDLSREIITNHTGGSLDEALTVFSIVNALTVNLPTITGVQILVDGKAVDTLAGHIDLRHPLERSLKWVRKGQ